MVTEYAEGPSLAEYIDTYGRLAPDMLYGLAAGLAGALTVIHAAGIVHRGPRAAAHRPAASRPADQHLPASQRVQDSPTQTILSKTWHQTGPHPAQSRISPDGGLDAVVWTSADGATWTRAPVSGLTGGSGHDLTALAASGASVTGIDSVQTQASQQFVVRRLPAG